MANWFEKRKKLLLRDFKKRKKCSKKIETIINYLKDVTIYVVRVILIFAAFIIIVSTFLSIILNVLVSPENLKDFTILYFNFILFTVGIATFSLTATHIFDKELKEKPFREASIGFGISAVILFISFLFGAMTFINTNISSYSDVFKAGFSLTILAAVIFLIRGIWKLLDGLYQIDPSK